MPSFIHATCQPDPAVPWLLHGCSNGSEKDVFGHQLAELTDVFAVHGRSPHTSLWPLESLLNSNEQLIDFDPRRQLSMDTENSDYCIPLGGVREGLCGKIVLLTRQR